MSHRYPGGIVSAAAPSTSLNNASGIWTLTQYLQLKAAGDPYWSYVSFLLGTTATNAAQNNTFLDGSTNNFTITRNGNTTQGSLSPYGARWSNYFDGAGDYLTSATATAPGTGDFTIEGWFNQPTIGSTRIIYDCRPSGTNGAYHTIYVDLNGYLSLYANSADLIKSTNVVTTNVWNHFALCRSGTSTRLFLNGVQQGSTYTDTNNWLMGSSRPLIGGDGVNQAGNFFVGYLSDIRAVNGTALYTTAFTPPAAPLTAISGTSLLTCQSNRFRDASSNNLAITAYGNASVVPFNPFGQPGYSTATYGGSAYFDGSGDYLTAASNDAYRMDQGDWTLEAWIYPTTTGSAMAVSSRGVYLSTYGFFFGMLSGGALYYEAGNGSWGTNGAYASPTGGVIANQWNHVAAVRSGTSFYIYANGVRVLNQASAAFGANVTAPLYVGSYVDGSQNIFNGNMTDYRFVKGTALYTGATYSAPTAPLTAVTNTSLLLNYTNAGLYDAAMQNDMETVGNAQVSSAFAKYGATALYSPNSTSYLKGRFNQSMAFGTGDFTIEAWVYSVATSAAYTCITSSRDGIASNANAIFFGLKPNTNQLTFYTSSEIIGTSTAVSTGAWTHVALVRSAGATVIYINGTSAGTATFTTSLTGTGMSVGNEYNGASGSGGIYIDDLRITKGYARYTTNFTPPTAALPVY